MPEALVEMVQERDEDFIIIIINDKAATSNEYTMKHSTKQECKREENEDERER